MSLQQRINEKKRELEQLSQVKQLADTLCWQLEQLETKLDTLADGTEGMNEHTSTPISIPYTNYVIKQQHLSCPTGIISSNPLSTYAQTDYENTEEPPLPETLVRLRIRDDNK
ncbi:CYFA0S01e08394g1_1 [Cyberlindnera fabianii]|uniref:DASH complex subunit DAD2 n=1 Tax=Cyberlindnera fabianii TaxID=36022 RepID=A0A061AR44_CYBFA|nr:CYFA0S01e08394g1_1 [Cyberlindnera fabianii]